MIGLNFLSKRNRSAVNRAENVIENLREAEYEAWKFYKKMLDNGQKYDYEDVKVARSAWQSLYVLAKECGISTHVEIIDQKSVV